MRKLGWIAVVVLLLAGATIQSGVPISEYAGQAWSWVYSSKPVGVIVLVESSDMAKLTKEQVAYLSDPKLRADMKAAGLKFAKVDPNTVDATGKTPPEFVKAIALAGDKLPRLVLVGSRGGCTDYVLPIDEASFRKRVGL
jgi:hypothetical protein